MKKKNESFSNIYLPVSTKSSQNKTIEDFLGTTTGLTNSKLIRTAIGKMNLASRGQLHIINNTFSSSCVGKRSISRNRSDLKVDRLITANHGALVNCNFIGNRSQ